MSLPKEKVEELLKGLEKKQLDDFHSKNVDRILKNYHPDATLVHKGAKSYYGHDEIREAFKPFTTEFAEIAEAFNPEYSSSSVDGEYLIRRGTYKAPPNPKNFAFHHIYKKHNGEYLLYHDEFEYSA